MAYGIDKRSSTYGNHNVWRSDVFVAGDKFTIDEIRIPFAQKIAANMTLKIKIYKDDASNTPSATDDTLVTVNNTNYPDNNRFIKIYPNIQCDNNFFLQFEWEGSSLLVVALPIIVKINIED